MAELIAMPKLGFDMAEGTLVEWVKQVGDTVNEGDTIAVVETDKANVEVPSFKSGVLRELLAEAGSVVPVGNPIAVIGTADEPIDVAALGVASGGAPKKKAEAQAAPAATPEEEAEPAAPAAEPEGRMFISPVARRTAEELGIDLSLVQGSGPDGRIVKRDIEEFLKQQGAKPTPSTTAPTPSLEPAGEDYRTERLTPIRQTIARRMVDSKQNYPAFYITMEVDMAAAMALRQQINAMVPEEGKVSVNDMVLKACAVALKQYPRLNASFAGNEIHIHNRVNIGVAVPIGNGLLTTVVRDCDRKSLAQIAREAGEMITRAREGRMRADDMTGGTFTTSNLGMFGVEDFVAIINPPQAAILAVGAVKKVPVVQDDGQLGVGTRMKVTISADHRVTDGAEATQFLVIFKKALEEPLRLLL